MQCYPCNTHTHAHAHMHSKHTHTQTHTHTRAHTHTNTCASSPAFARGPCPAVVHMHTRTHAHRRCTHTYGRAYVHTHTHTHTHAHAQISTVSSIRQRADSQAQLQNVTQEPLRVMALPCFAPLSAFVSLLKATPATCSRTHPPPEVQNSLRVIVKNHHPCGCQELLCLIANNLRPGSPKASRLPCQNPVRNPPLYATRCFLLHTAP
jgi:hypothetical protein